MRPKPRHENDPILTAATSFLISSTRIERLNKLCNRLEAQGESMSDETSRRISLYRSEIVKEHWSGAVAATELGAHLKTSNVSEIRKFALSLAPDAERLAIAKFKEPSFEMFQPELSQLKEARRAEEVRFRRTETVRIFREETSQPFANLDHEQLEGKLHLLMLALDRMVVNSKLELRDRGIFIGSEVRETKDKVSSGRALASKPDFDEENFLKVYVIGTASWFVAMGGTAITASLLPNGPKDFGSALDLPIVRVEAGLYLSSFAGEIGLHIRGLRNNFKRSALKILDGEIDKMASRVIWNREEEPSGVALWSRIRKPKRFFPMDLDNVPTADIEATTDALVNLREQVAKLIIPGNERADIATAYSIAANSQWKVALISARDESRALERGLTL